MSERRFAAFAVAAIAASTLLRHVSQLGAWWTYDDPQLLIQAIRESYLTLFTSPLRWRMYSASNLTPLLPASYKLDLQLAGMRASWFYAHQLIAIAAAGSLLYAYSRTFATRAASLVAAAGFIVMPLTLEVSHMLMLRHYVEGLALALGALLAWNAGANGGRRRYVVLAGVLYFLAMCCKELYAPLPLVMIADSIQRRTDWRVIARSLAAPTAAAAVYLPWRLWMLHSAGGYGAFSITAAILRLPQRAWFGIAGSAPTAVQLLWGLLLVALLVLLRGLPRGRTALVWTLVVICLVLPVIPVVIKYERRYVFAISVAVVFAAAMLADRIRSRPLRIAALTALIALPALAGFHEQWILETRDRVMRAEGSFIWSAPPQPRVLYGTSGGWYLDGLAWLRGEIKHETAPAYYSSTMGLVLDGIAPERVVSAIGWPDARVLRNAAVRRRRAPSVDVAVGRRGNRFLWKMTPGRRWSLLSPMGLEMFALPTVTGSLPFPGEFYAPSCDSRKLTMRFVAEQSDGTWFASPPLPFPQSDGDVRWQSQRVASSE